jgi:hypothetical protein
MKIVNKRYQDHDICSIVGTRTIILSIDNYIKDTIDRLNEIQSECSRPDYNPDILLIPTIQICDSSSEVLHHRLDLLKSSLDRYLFADDDFKTSSIKHDKMLKIKRLQPHRRFKSKLQEPLQASPRSQLDFVTDMGVDVYDDGTQP